MLAARLPRLPYQTGYWFGGQLESAALTYLSQYNADAVAPRVSDAYVRAWDMDFFYMVPRVPGGRPGYVVAGWSGNNVQRLTVAIEGLTSAYQVWVANGGAGFIGVPDLQGQVFAPLLAYSTTIMAELQADTRSRSYFGHSRAALIFTGFSLGAAVSELLAYRFQKLYPYKSIRLFKFGAPAVGTRRWEENKSGDVESFNVVCGLDDISLLPYMSGTNLAGLGGLSNFGTIFYSYDAVGVRFSPDGQQLPYLRERSLAAYNRLCRDQHFPLTIDNPWSYHSQDVYRVMHCNMVHGQADILAARYLHLEHNDENQWQALFRPRVNPDPAWKTIVLPGPDAYVVDSTPAQIAVAQQQAAQPLIPQQVLAEPVRSGPPRLDYPQNLRFLRVR